MSRLGGGDPASRFRAEVVLGIGVLQLVIVGLLCISELIWGTTVVGVVCLIALSAILLVLLDVVRTGDISRAAIRFMAILFIVSTILNLGSGGLTIGVSIALPSLVLIGGLVLPFRAAIVLFVLVVLQLLLVAALANVSAPFPIRPDPEWAHMSVFRIPILISIGTAFVGLLVRRAMVRHRMELARTQQELADNEKKLREIIEYSRGLICTHTVEGKLLSVNPAAAQALGYEADDLIGWNIRDLVPEEQKAYFAGYLNRMQSNGVESGSIFLNARNGDLRIWEYNNRLCSDPASKPYVLVNATDMTERRELEEKLREQNIRDPLTGCFNRRYLALLESRFCADQHWGCIVVDLDNFKQVNDTHGHRRGDEILVAIGHFLNQYAGQRDAVIRMGGDEFLLLLPDGGAEMESVAQRMRIAADREAPCEISIGWSSRISSETVQQTIDRADLQLFKRRTSERRPSSSLDP